MIEILLSVLIILALLFGLTVTIWLRFKPAIEHANWVDWGSPFLNHLDGLNRLFCLNFHRLQHDSVPLPAHGPAVVVANHISGLDPLVMLASCRRPLRFLIAVEQHNRPGLKWLFEKIGCIPVDRTGRPEKALREALEALKRGEIVALFPQGGIRLADENPEKLKAGAVRLAQLANVPIIPLHISGVAGEGAVVSAVFRRSQVQLSSQPPIDCSAQDTKECLEQVRQAIIRL